MYNYLNEFYATAAHWQNLSGHAEFVEIIAISIQCQIEDLQDALTFSLIKFDSLAISKKIMKPSYLIRVTRLEFFNYLVFFFSECKYVS